MCRWHRLSHREPTHCRRHAAMPLALAVHPAWDGYSYTVEASTPCFHIPSRGESADDQRPTPNLLRAALPGHVLRDATARLADRRRRDRVPASDPSRLVDDNIAQDRMHAPDSGVLVRWGSMSMLLHRSGAERLGVVVHRLNRHPDHPRDRAPFEAGCQGPSDWRSCIVALSLPTAP